MDAGAETRMGVEVGVKIGSEAGTTPFAEAHGKFHWVSEEGPVTPVSPYGPALGSIQLFPVGYWYSM